MPPRRCADYPPDARCPPVFFPDGERLFASFARNRLAVWETRFGSGSCKRPQSDQRRTPVKLTGEFTLMKPRLQRHGRRGSKGDLPQPGDPRPKAGHVLDRDDRFCPRRLRFRLSRWLDFLAVGGEGIRTRLFDVETAAERAVNTPRDRAPSRSDDAHAHRSYLDTGWGRPGGFGSEPLPPPTTTQQAWRGTSKRPGRLASPPTICRTLASSSDDNTICVSGTWRPDKAKEPR